MRSRMGCLSGAVTVAAVLLSMLCPAALAQSPPAQLPIEAFAHLPLTESLMLSPDGQRVAAFVNQSDRTLLVTRPIDAEESTPVLTTQDKDLRFRWARWVSNERLLVSMSYASKRFDVGIVETRLVSIRFDGSGLVPLSKAPAEASSLPQSQFQDHIIDWLPDDGHHVLQQLNGYGGAPAIYKLNVDDGSKQVVQEAQDYIYGWMTDAQHRLRLGLRHQLGKAEVRVRDSEDGPWRTLWKFKVSELGIDRANVVTPLGFGLDPQELFIRAEHEGRQAVFSVRLDQPELPRTLRLAHPTLDVDGELLRSPATGAVLGLSARLHEGSADAESAEELWDPSWRARMRAIDRALPQRKNTLVSISRDEQRYIVHSIGNGQPGEYFLGDRKTGKLSLVGETYPDLPPAQLVGKRAVKIKARDGLSLNAYLTLPHGTADAGPRPLVLLPHGGPQSRDDTQFDVQTEFLANRGYAVLQVDFRGSAGYGRAFVEAGKKRWGLEMQDDLTDARAWAVETGIADPARVCIVGASYGGYAALMGLVKTPTLYRCGVSFAGVTDLVALIEYEANYVGGAASIQEQVGWAWHDRKQLRATSPVQQAQRIEAPLLLIHGTADRVVPVEQGRDMAKALKEAGKIYRYVEQDGADHHWSRSEDRLQFFQELEKFLDLHLKGASK